MEEKTLDSQIEPSIELSGFKPPNKIVEFWKTFKKKISGREKSIVTVVIVGIGVFGLLVFSTFQLLLKFGFIKQKPLPTKEQVYVSPTPTPTREPSPKNKSLVLKRGEEIIYDFSPYGEWHIVRWENLLFYGTGGYDWNFEVFSHNLDTGETELIYEEDSSDIYLSDLQAIDETLFFSIGGYLVQGATYWLDLPPDGPALWLADSRNAKIEYMNDRHWLIGGEGDACWRFTDYSFVDIANKKVTPIITSHGGCMEGEEYLGIDRTDRMILAHHTSGQNWHTLDPEPGVYTYVVALRLSDLEKGGIIAKQEMPEKIVMMRFSEEDNRLLLMGDSIYLYDLSLNTLEKIVDSPWDWQDWRNILFEKWEGEVVCVRGTDISERIEINLSEKKIIRGSAVCEPEPSQTRSYEESRMEEVRVLNEQLNLPSGYELVLEERD